MSEQKNEFKPYLISLSCGFYLLVDETVRPIQKAVFDATKTGIISPYLAELLKRHKEIQDDFAYAMSSMETLKSAIDSPSRYSSFGLLGEIAHRQYLNDIGGDMNTSRWGTVLKLVQAEGLLDHIAEKDNMPHPPAWSIPKEDYAPFLILKTLELIAEYKTAVGKALGEDFGQAVEFTKNGAWWNLRMPYRCLDGIVRFLKDSTRPMRKTDIAINLIRWRRTDAI